MIVGNLDTMCNTPEDARARNAKINQAKPNVGRFKTLPPHDGRVMIIGGGPSLLGCLDEIKARQKSGGHVWATNNTCRLLQSHGIQPNAHVLLDARPENAEFVTCDLAITYFLHVSCDPGVYDAVKNCRVCMYDLNSEATGTTVGLKALYLAGFSGFAEFYLYGFDSSYQDGKHHAYPQALNDGQRIIEVVADGRNFHCAPWMVVQAEEFQSIAASFAEQDKIIHIAGDGLLPHIARRLVHRPIVLTAVWDLALCPTSYDVATFLGEAESRRLEIGAEFIDFVIQPGPRDGYRADDLPPNLGAREGMLYRVIVGLARLLPSVRNIEVLKSRRAIDAENVFPTDYTVNSPKAHYGHNYASRAKPILAASQSAGLFVERCYPKPYVTITLREASHWPARNSNRQAWMKTAAWIERQGYQVIWVPDAESHDANLFSFDVDMRLALYERAVVNLGINNGPMMILPYTDARYLVFKIITESVPWTTREFHDKWGTVEGDQPGGRGCFIYESDEYKTIIAELKRFFGSNALPQTEGLSNG